MKHTRSNNHARFTHPSKYERTVAQSRADEAIREGEALRRKLQGRRILEISNDAYSPWTPDSVNPDFDYLMRA